MRTFLVILTLAVLVGLGLAYALKGFAQTTSTSIGLRASHE